MVKIKIGEYERVLEEADEQWINQQINQRRSAGENVCVIVTIQETNLNLMLSTPTCGGHGFGAGRPLNSQESRILDLWKDRRMNQQDFTGGNLIAFLHQLRRLL